MKKFFATCLALAFTFSLSGCTLGTVTDYFTKDTDSDIQNVDPNSTRVYMDEVRGTLKSFTGSQITLSSDSTEYTFDISQATIECQNGILNGDSISVIYEGQLDSESTDTSAVRALKVVDDYHSTDELEDTTTYGQVQSVSTNTITIKTKESKTITFPITGSEQYYQAGLKTGIWVYVHHKGTLKESSSDDANTLDATHVKVTSVSDIDPLNVPSPTPTPVPAEGQEVTQENQLRCVIQSVSTNVLSVKVDSSDVVLSINMSAIPCYFSGGITAGSHMDITYTGTFNGTTLDGITVLGVTGEVPEETSERSIAFYVSGEITGTTSNTVTIVTNDGVYITFYTDDTENTSIGGLQAGSSVKITFNPATSRDTNIFTAIKIEGL